MNALPTGARQLGIRVKPVMSVSIGMRDPTSGRFWAIDYFRATDQDEWGLRFHAHYGDKPRELDNLRLPGTRERCLEIRYRAFKGGQDGPGVLVALGTTNFGAMDYAGGPDTLQVWNQDGTVDYIETAGLDATTGEPLDETAKDLGLELQTTFTFMMPDVLPLGAFAVVRTQGKESTDNLHFHTATWYSLFGAKVPFVLRPTLILKPTTMRPLIQTKDGPKRIVKESWALDLRLPETEEVMLERGREMMALAASSLYNDSESAGGTVTRALPAGPPAAATAGDQGEGAGLIPVRGADSTAGAAGEPLPASSPEPSEPEPETPAVDDQARAAAIEAASVLFQGGKYNGKSIGNVHQVPDPSYLKWSMGAGAGRYVPRESVETFMRVFRPAEYHEAIATRETT